MRFLACFIKITHPSPYNSKYYLIFESLNLRFQEGIASLELFTTLSGLYVFSPSTFD
jgi:hypothetical protein